MAAESRHNQRGRLDIMGNSISGDDGFVITVVHAAVQGRARLHVSALRNRPDLEALIEQELAGRNGIRRVSASTITSNVLVMYDPAEELPQIIGLLRVALVSAEQKTREPQKAEPAQAAPQSKISLFRQILQNLFSFAGKRATQEGAGRQPDLSRFKEQPDFPWHAMEASTVAQFWRVHTRNGLSSATALRARKEYGPNIIPAPVSRSPLRIFLDQFKGLPVVLLLGSAALSIATAAIGDAIVIAGVVLLNAGIGALTEVQAERTISSLLSFAEPQASVVRNGVVQEIAAADVVPGDILRLARGVEIPADARLLEADNLTVDESALTGESMPVAKSAHALAVREIPLGDRMNMVYRGTVVTGGSGVAVVIATGRFTQIGKIQSLIAESAPPQTPLQRQMDRLGRQLVWVTAGIAGLVFAIGLARGYSVLEMLRTAVSLAVAAVPEGLPTVVTVALAGGVAALLRHNVMVRRIEAVEALGTVEVVCFDKTGTLTLNRMSAVEAYAGMRRYSIAGGIFFAGNHPIHAASHPELRHLLEVCCLCTEAEVTGAHESPRYEGSPTETALLRMAVNSGIEVERLRARYPLRRMIHRARGQNYMASLHDAMGGGSLLAVKGSPSEVLALSNRYAQDGELHPLTESERQAIQSENDRMAGAALRVLGVAYAEDSGGAVHDLVLPRAIFAAETRNIRPGISVAVIVTVLPPKSLCQPALKTSLAV